MLFVMNFIKGHAVVVSKVENTRTGTANLCFSSVSDSEDSFENNHTSNVL